MTMNHAPGPFQLQAPNACKRISSQTMTRTFGGLSKLLSLVILLVEPAPANGLDLKDAVIVSPAGLSGPERKAVLMLVEEVEKRTHIRWPESAAWPASNAPVIAVGPESALEQFAAGYARQFCSGSADCCANFRCGAGV